MNRADLQRLSRLRRREARILLNANLSAGADFPDKDRASESYTHNLSKLLRTAGLQPGLDQAVIVSPALARNWAIAKDWKETSRYDSTIDMKKARALYKAATARRTGVLAWLRRSW